MHATLMLKLMLKTTAISEAKYLTRKYDSKIPGIELDRAVHVRVRQHRRREWVANTSPTLCTGFEPGTPASVPPYLVLQGAPTHLFARTESRRTASVPPYPVLQEAPTHYFARTESRHTASVPPYAVLQRAPTHRCARTESGRTALKLLQAGLAMNRIFEVLGGK
jgi:hypothetical protein